MNPLTPIYARCNTGDPAEKYANLPDFPRMIDVEPAGLCNFKCVFCPTGVGALGRPQGFMAYDLWRKIVDECEPHGTALRPYGWGEPLLHPKIVDMIAYASSADLMTHLNSNGSKLTRPMIEALINAGLTSLKLSFQGVDRESYWEMRNTDFFEQLISKIELVAKLRGKRERPWIAVSTTTTWETPEMIEAFRTRVAPHVDELSVGKTIFGFFDLKAAHLKPAERERIEQLMAMETATKRHPEPCPQVFDSLTIHWDGKAAVCCNAYGSEGTFGNVADTSIAELWQHSAIEAYRERLARKDYDAPLCRDCWDYMDCTKREAA